MGVTILGNTDKKNFNMDGINTIHFIFGLGLMLLGNMAYYLRL